jgi:hypothetical protein
MSPEVLGEGAVAVILFSHDGGKRRSQCVRVRVRASVNFIKTNFRVGFL